MLVWATEFPAARGTKANDIIPIAKRWLMGSPHVDWKEEDFGAETAGDITTIVHSGETLRIGSAELDGQKWAGIQHVWMERDEREWTTELLGYEKDEQVWVSVRLDCNLLAPGIELPKPNKPYLVKLLLQELGGGFDSLLPIDDEPVRLREDEVDLAANLMIGRLHNQQPVVYASAAPRGTAHKYGIRIGTLSRALAGMAHVVVEPSRHFSFTLSRHVDGVNAYGGAVSVYWPNNAAQEVRFLPHDFDNTKQMEEAIVDVIRTALTHIRPKPEATWAYLREAISRMRVEALKATGSTEVDEYIREFGAELDAKEERLQSAEREIQRLHAVIRRLESSGGVSKDGILSLGKEQEFYPGELRDAIVATLTNGKATLVQDSRWMHLVDDILAANPPTTNQKQIEDGVKECLSGMTKFSAAERKLLEDLGFEVDVAGKHAKAVYHGDDRYMFSISKTPSDHRSGRNVVSDINRKIFGA